MRSGGGAGDVDLVIQAANEPVVADIERLNLAVADWSRGQVTEPTPTFPFLVPGFDLGCLESGQRVGKRLRQIRPHGSAHEVDQLQIGPVGLERVTGEALTRSSSDSSGRPSFSSMMTWSGV